MTASGRYDAVRNPLPLGALVHFWPMARAGQGCLGVIASEPYPLGHGALVVMVTDIDGERRRPMALTHVEVIAA